MLKEKRLLRLIFLFFLSLFFCFLIRNSYSMDESKFWKNYRKWFEYKKTQPLNELQKDVIMYFEKATLILEKAENTWEASINHPEPAPKEALRIVDKCHSEFIKLKLLPIVKKHYDASVMLIEIIKRYHLKRADNPDSGDLQLLARSAIPYESIQSSEYFRIMKETGLFDNIEEEMRKISPDQETNKTNFTP